MTTGHMKGQCAYAVLCVRVCVCVWVLVSGGKMYASMSNEADQALGAPHLEEWRHPHRRLARRWLVAPKWTISSVDFMFSNLLSFSPASQQLLRLWGVRVTRRAEGKANTVDRGAKKCAVILFDALSTFIDLFFARPCRNSFCLI